MANIPGADSKGGLTGSGGAPGTLSTPILRSFPLQSLQICTAKPACQLEESQSQESGPESDPARGADISGADSKGGAGIARLVRVVHLGRVLLQSRWCRHPRSDLISPRVFIKSFFKT